MISFPECSHQESRRLSAFIAEFWREDVRQAVNADDLDHLLVKYAPAWVWIQFPEKCRTAFLALGEMAGDQFAHRLNPLHLHMLCQWSIEFRCLPTDDDVLIPAERKHVALAGDVLAALPDTLFLEVDAMVLEVLDGRLRPGVNLELYQDFIAPDIWKQVEACLPTGGRS